MERIGRLVDKIVDIAGYLSGWLVAVMCLLIFAEVIMRYGLDQPLMLADELSAYMLVALCYIGAAYTFRERGHVRITALVTRVPTKVANWLRLITLILAFIFAVGLCQAAYHFMQETFKYGLTSPTWLRVPLQWPHMTVIVGFSILALLLLTMVIRAVKNLRGDKSIEDATR